MPTLGANIARFLPALGRRGRRELDALASAAAVLAEAPPLPVSERQRPVPAEPGRVKTRFRTIFISDVHLGTRGAKAEALLDFLKHTSCETLYLVGDIFDGWSLRRSWYWHQSHNDVIQKILRKARKGVRVVYVPGNHDEVLRDYTGLHFGGILVERDAIHEAADGKRYLVLHGDRFDGVVMTSRYLSHLGGTAYRAALRANGWYNALRRRLGLPYWSLSEMVHRVKNRVGLIEDYGEAAAAEARRRGVEGVICGHIHNPELERRGGIVYANTGDWVESCTALVEHEDGRLELLAWKAAAPRERLPAVAAL